jgi:hypothetical protein
VNDLGFHLILFAVIGFAIVAASAVFSEFDDAKALKTLPRRLLVFFAGCGILTAILLVLEHTVARIN